MASALWLLAVPLAVLLVVSCFLPESFWDGAWRRWDGLWRPSDDDGGLPPKTVHR